MATNPKSRGTKAATNLPRPRRTLVLFLAAIIALYGLVALIDLNTKKGDDSAWQPRLGLDLQGGTRITFEAKSTEGKVTKPKLEQARDIIDQRVNATGVSESEVTTQGEDQIIVEIPGEKRANIVDQVGKTRSCGFGSCGPATWRAPPRRPTRRSSRPSSTRSTGASSRSTR